MRVNPPFHSISVPAEHPSRPVPKDVRAPKLLFQSSKCIDRAVAGGFLPPPRNDTQPDPPNDIQTDPPNDSQTDPPAARAVPCSDKRPPSPILLSFPISPRRKNFYRDHPTNAFSSAKMLLFRFIVVKFRSLLSHERPVCTLRCRRLLHFPRPSSEARGFFCPSPRKRRSGSALASRAPVADAHFLLQSSRFPILRARFTQSAPSARPFSATVPRHPRLRPRPPPAARNTVPFTPSPRPASPRPATLPRNHPTTPPRTGLQARFVPRRSRSGP